MVESGLELFFESVSGSITEYVCGVASYHIYSQLRLSRVVRANHLLTHMTRDSRSIGQICENGRFGTADHSSDEWTPGVWGLSPGPMLAKFPNGPTLHREIRSL
jgi:hypothetical protein